MKKIPILTKTIRETITREYCNVYKDLECVNKKFNIPFYRERDKIYRCIHCYQYWCYELRPNGGMMDFELVRCCKPKKQK